MRQCGDWKKMLESIIDTCRCHQLQDESRMTSQEHTTAIEVVQGRFGAEKNVSSHAVSIVQVQVLDIRTLLQVQYEQVH